jgi:hypothetical protein
MINATEDSAVAVTAGAQPTINPSGNMVDEDKITKAQPKTSEQMVEKESTPRPSGISIGEIVTASQLERQQIWESEYDLSM